MLESSTLRSREGKGLGYPGDGQGRPGGAVAGVRSLGRSAVLCRVEGLWVTLEPRHAAEEGQDQGDHGSDPGQRPGARGRAGEVAARWGSRELVDLEC